MIFKIQINQLIFHQSFLIKGVFLLNQLTKPMNSATPKPIELQLFFSAKKSASAYKTCLLALEDSSTTNLPALAKLQTHAEILYVPR